MSASSNDTPTAYKSSAVAQMAAQCFTSWIFALELRYLSLMHSFSLNHTMPKTKFFGLHFCCREHGTEIEQGLTSHQTHYRPYRGRVSLQRLWCNWLAKLPNLVKESEIIAITPFKVIISSTDGKKVCDFLCANNSNLHTLLHCFQDMADYGLIFAVDRRYCFLPLNSRLQNLALRS